MKKLALKVELDTSDVDEGVERTSESVESLGDTAKKTGNEMKQGFKAAEQGSKALGSGIKDLIKALGIIGVALAVFNYMRDILSKNQKVMDALSTATTAFEIIINRLFEAIEPLGKVMSDAFDNPRQAVADLWKAIKENLLSRVEGLINGYKAVGKVLKAAFELDWDAIKEGAEDFGTAMIQATTGLNEAQQAAVAEGFKEFVKDVKSATIAAVDQAKALQSLRNEVILLEAEQRRLMLTYQNEAEIQRQIRDDISLTIQERLAANEELGRILTEQTEKEEAIAMRRLELAKAELAVNKTSIELQAAVIDAETELADVRERINGQRSEQLTNQKALEKELFDIQQELRVATLSAREKEIEELEVYYEMLAEKARIAGESDIEIEAARIRALADLRDKFRKEDLEKEKAANAKKMAEEKKIKDAKIQAATDVSGALGTIAAAVEQQGKAGLIASKVLTVAQIAIDTAKAISGAIAQAQSVPFPGNIAAIAVGVASVIAGIASAVATLNSANVPGPSATVPTAPPSVTAPTITPVTTNTTSFGNTEQAELAPIQAFVVETQLTNTQNNISQLEGQATFG